MIIIPRMGRFLSCQIPAISLFGLLFVACAPEEVCITDNTTLIEVGFYKELYAGTDSATMEQDTLIVNRVTALGTDSIFVTSASLTGVSLPVNTGSNETTYIFELPSGDQTLQFSYQVFTRFVSEDCGLEVIIDSLQVGQTSFDSVVVTQRLLNTDIENNVEVYR